MTLDDLLAPGVIFQIGIVPNCINIINRIDGVDFDATWPQRYLIEIDGLQLPVIGRAQLLHNKKPLGGPKTSLM